MGKLRNVLGLVGLMAVLAIAPGAFAEDVVSYPRPWQIDFQEAVTPVAEKLHDLHNMLMIIITAITLFVMFLLLYVMWRFSAKRNPVPSKVTHNTLIEVVWTVVPVIILVIIAIPSFQLLYLSDKAPNPEMTLKVTASQFLWNYEYPDHEGFNFNSVMMPYDQVKERDLQNLEVDQEAVVPVDTEVRLLVTASDVLHSFAVPSFAVKLDAVPGRLHEGWFKATKTGTYYGQCSELCGQGHAFMPIKIKVVSKEAFAAWVEEAKKKFATNDVTGASKIAAVSTSKE